MDAYSSLPIPREFRLLEGQVAVITGGASGIGEGAARLFTRHGARVVIADIQDALGEQLAREIGGVYMHCDVGKEEDIQKTWEKAYALDNRLDIVFNNAGIGREYSGIESVSMEKFDAVLNVNLRAAVMGVKHAARLMIPAGRGSILCTGSVSGILGGNSPSSYAISKSAVVGLVRQAAAELKQHGIRVNVVSPSTVPTAIKWSFLQSIGKDLGLEVPDYMKQEGPITDTALKNRTLRVEDVANAALFLASDMGAMVSGHNLLVDVGMTTSVPWLGVPDFKSILAPTPAPEIALTEQLSNGARVEDKKGLSSPHLVPGLQSKNI